MMHKYEIILYWSNEDRAFVKVVFRSLLLVSELLVLKLSPTRAGMGPLWEASEAVASKSREPR